jgi:hypothetical protein
MESVTTEELLIEEGKSGDLIAAFKTLEEATVVDGPKYTPKTCRELARAIACRNYGKCLLELSYLFVIAGACDRRDGRFEKFFCESGPARANAFRGYIQESEPFPSGIRRTDGGVTVETDEGIFTITYGRMPFLSAFVDLLITTIGYGVLTELTEPLQGSVPSRTAIGEAANRIARQFYDYLREHLPSAHAQRKAHLLIDFVNERQGGRSGPDDVNDDALLAFWLDHSSDTEDSGDYRTYQSVFQAGVELRLLMAHALDKYRMSGARSIGTDVKAGEIDPGDIEDAAKILDSATMPLQALSEPPLNAVKFLNIRETETASEVALGPGIANSLAQSVFRNAVFGRAQSRITNALRHKRVTAKLLTNAAETDYPARLQDYHDFCERLERSMLAALHVLTVARRPEAIDLAISLKPDMDLSALAEGASEEPEWQDDSVVSITAVRAADRFYERGSARAGGDDPLSELMAEARKAFRANARQGFNDDDIEDEEILDTFADAVTPLLALRKEVNSFLKFTDETDWSRPYTEDKETFTQQFQRLYGDLNGD